jgi:putative membrane protein
MTPGDLPLNSRLAVDRTRLAYERTLMAWIRTAASLISFGFTIYKFFQFLRDGGGSTHDGLLSPRHFALIMIGIGLSALAIATIDHRRHMQQLRADYGPVPFSLSAVVSFFVAVLGILGLISVALRF